MSHYFYITPEEYAEAEKVGVDPQSLDRRVRELGWKKEKAMTTPLGKITNRKKWAKVAEQNGIKYQTFMNRVNNWGWDEERAATEPLQDRAKTARDAAKNRKDRITNTSLVKKAEQNGISYHTYRARIKKGMDPEKAATTPLMSRSETGKKGYQRNLEKNGNFKDLIFKKRA